jgi:hypothetical protein
MYMQCGNDRRYHKFQAHQSSLIASSHLVKHTADVLISSRRGPLMVVIVVHLGTPHAHVGWSGWCCQSGRIGNPRCTWSAWPSHVVSMCRCNRLSVSHLRHSPHSTTAQPRILVAVAPAVDGALDEAALSSQARIQLCEGPTHGVALGLVVQAVALVLVFGTACSGVDAVLCLELRRKILQVYRFDVAAYRVLHFDPVARVLKSNPLHAVLVLLDDERCGCGNRARRSIGVHVGASRSTGVHVRRAHGRSLVGCLWWPSQTRRGTLERCLLRQRSLVDARLGASSDSRSVRVGLVRMLHWLILRLMRHQNGAAHGRRLLLARRMRRIWRMLNLGGIRRVVHGLLHRLSAVNGPSVLIMLRGLD